MTETTATRSYRPGRWFGIFGPHATVVLPPSEKARVGELWGLVDDGAGFDVVLDALISGGLRELPGFVLVSTEDGESRVVIRGAARASFTTAGDPVEVSGSQATTWAEQTVSGVVTTRLVVGGEPPDDEAPLLPIAHGLVRVCEVVSPPGEVARPAPVPVPEPLPEPLPEPVPESLPEPVPEPLPEPLPESAPSGPIGPEPYDDVPPVMPPPPPFGVPSGPPPAVPVPPAVVEHDGLTSGGPAETPTEAVPAQPLVSRPVAALVFSSGETIEVDRAVLVGRAPEARRFAAGDQPQLVAVPSPAQEISSTHLEIRPGTGADHGSAVVTDLGSTNGTVVVQPGLPPEDLQPGIAVQLVPGAVIDLGDGVTIQVINP